MTTISLPPDLDRSLSEEARRLGKTPESLALETLRERFTPPAGVPPPGETLLDFLEGYVGTVDGTSEALSERCGERFAEGIAQDRATDRESP
ncbi:MAG: hypothetical protein AB7I30_15790 [Isosphaeraceae bacterium]